MSPNSLSYAREQIFRKYAISNLFFFLQCFHSRLLMIFIYPPTWTCSVCVICRLHSLLTGIMYNCVPCVSRKVDTLLLFYQYTHHSKWTKLASKRLKCFRACPMAQDECSLFTVHARSRLLKVVRVL